MTRHSYFSPSVIVYVQVCVRKRVNVRTVRASCFVRMSLSRWGMVKNVKNGNDYIPSGKLTQILKMAY